jgi:hypothetical protein
VVAEKGEGKGRGQLSNKARPFWICVLAGRTALFDDHSLAVVGNKILKRRYDAYLF